MKKRPIVALIYDFDGTLSPGNMQEFGFIQAIGKTPDEFWRMSDGLAVGQDASNVLSYMKMMFDEARKNGITLRRSDFRKFGRHIQLFDGVREWFGMINEYGESRGVQIEHYINSSGLKEIIEGSGIAHHFKKIYACEFYYRDGAACWPKLDVNFTNKTQFVYRINKGVLEVSEDKKLNDSMPDDSKRIPFTNMIYVGDGLSDVPCMKMMRSYGGQAIAVYQESNRTGVEELLARGRVDFIFPADYRAGTALDITVQNIIRKMAICDALTAENAAQMRSIGQVELSYQETLF